MIPSDKDRFPKLVAAFDAALIDGLRQHARENGGSYRASATTLKPIAIRACKEALESEFDDEGKPLPVSAGLALNVWNAVISINESAYSQRLERLEKANTLGFKVIRGARATAAGFVE